MRGNYAKSNQVSKYWIDRVNITSTSQLAPKMKDHIYIDLATDGEDMFEAPEYLSFLSSEQGNSIIFSSIGFITIGVPFQYFIGLVHINKYRLNPQINHLELFS